MSIDGKREAWRLIGLSAVRREDNEAFEFFIKEYSNFNRNKATDVIYYFVQGFRERLSGNFRQALQWYEKIQGKSASSDVYRELAYLYAFERNFDEAQSCIVQAKKLTFGNPYVLDILVMILLEYYKNERKAHIVNEIDAYLSELKMADMREDTNFYISRLKMRDVIVEGNLSSLSDLFNSRRTLPIMAKLALLDMLSIKGKDHQYDELLEELKKTLRDRKNPIVEVEMARIEIEHLSLKKQYKDSARILGRYQSKFTEKCCEQLIRNIPESFIRSL